MNYNNGRFILSGKKAIPCPDLLTWGKWIESADRKVALDTVRKTKISTVFLGLDYNFNKEGDPILFETMIFGGKHNGFMERYETWEQAEAGHKKALAMVLGKAK